MANRLATATAWLAGMLQTHAGDAVSYHGADGAPAVTLTATRGQTTFREDPSDNRSAAIERSADFLFDPNALRTALGRWPAEGDRISAAPSNPIDGVSVVWYRVTKLAGEPCYRVEPQTALIRVHTLELWED